MQAMKITAKPPMPPASKAAADSFIGNGRRGIRGKAHFLFCAENQAVLCANLRTLAQKIHEEELQGSGYRDKNVHEAASLVDWLGIFQQELRFPLEVEKRETPDFVIRMGERKREIGLEITRLTNPNVNHVLGMQDKGIIPRGPFFAHRNRSNKEESEKLVTGCASQEDRCKLGIGGWTAGPEPGLQNFTNAIQNIVGEKAGKLRKFSYERQCQLEVFISFDMIVGPMFWGFSSPSRFKNSAPHKEGLIRWFCDNGINFIRKEDVFRRIVIVGYAEEPWHYFVGDVLSRTAEFHKFSDPFGTEKILSP